MGLKLDDQKNYTEHLQRYSYENLLYFSIFLIAFCYCLTLTFLEKNFLLVICAKVSFIINNENMQISDINSSKILFSLHIHTSSKTFDRLDKFFRKYRKLYPFIKYYIVVSKYDVVPFDDVDVIHSSCTSHFVGGIDGLVCRDIASYHHFLNHTEEGDWLFRAMDDTIVHIDNLIKLINQLNKFYQPQKHVVFRGCQNFFVKGKWYLGGGSGWLSSRAMIQLHEIQDYSFTKYFSSSFNQQDDTTETIIVEKVFQDLDQWRDPRYIEVCCNCDGKKFIQKDFSSIKICPLDDVYKLKDIVSFHPQHKVRNEEMIGLFDSMPDNLYYFKSFKNDCSNLCFLKPNGTSGYKASTQFMKEHVHLFTIDDILKGRNQINFSDPIYREYLEEETRLYKAISNVDLSSF